MSDGLEGVIAADTMLSEVDGDAGRLVIRGYSLDQLSGLIREQLEALQQSQGSTTGFPAAVMNQVGEP